MKRVAKFDADRNSPIGAWSVTSKGCPLLPHLKALGMKPKPCVSGMSTSIQGAIPIAFCEHYVKDSVTNEGKRLHIECKHALKDRPC